MRIKNRIYYTILSALAICFLCFQTVGNVYAMRVSASHEGGITTEKVEAEVYQNSYVAPAAYFEEASEELRTYSETVARSPEDDNNDLWMESWEPDGEGDEIWIDEPIEYAEDIMDEDIDVVDEDVELSDGSEDPVSSDDDVVDEDAEVTAFPIDQEALEDYEDGYGDY